MNVFLQKNESVMTLKTLTNKIKIYFQKWWFFFSYEQLSFWQKKDWNLQNCDCEQQKKKTCFQKKTFVSFKSALMSLFIVLSLMLSLSITWLSLSASFLPSSFWSKIKLTNVVYSSFQFLFFSVFLFLKILNWFCELSLIMIWFMNSRSFSAFLNLIQMLNMKTNQHSKYKIYPWSRNCVAVHFNILCHHKSNDKKKYNINHSHYWFFIFLEICEIDMYL